VNSGQPRPILFTVHLQLSLAPRGLYRRSGIGEPDAAPLTLPRRSLPKPLRV